MSRVCPSCRYDAGFEAAVCPQCGYGRAAGAPAPGFGLDAGGDGRTIAESRYEGGGAFDGGPTVAERRSDRTVFADDATNMDRDEEATAYFFVKSGPQRAKTFRLRSVTTIGREAGAGIHLTDPRVSRLHAHVRENGRHYVFQDLEAANHSFLLVGHDERRIRGPHVLADGDEIRMGSTILKFIAPQRGRPR